MNKASLSAVSSGLSVSLAIVLFVACGSDKPPAAATAPGATPAAPTPIVASGKIPVTLGTAQTFSTAAQPGYSFTVPTPAWYEIHVEGAPLDPIAALYEGTTAIAENDDISETDRNAKIVRKLKAGPHHVVVHELGGNAMAGRITVKLATGPAGAGVLQAGQQMIVQTRDAPANHDYDASVSVVFIAPSAGKYVFTAAPESRAADPVLILVQNGNDLATDDDGGGGRTSKIEMDLQPGPYQLWVRDHANDAERIKLTAMMIATP